MMQNTLDNMACPFKFFQAIGWITEVMTFALLGKCNNLKKNKFGFLKQGESLWDVIITKAFYFKQE